MAFIPQDLNQEKMLFRRLYGLFEQVLQVSMVGAEGELVTIQVMSPLLHGVGDRP